MYKKKTYEMSAEERVQYVFDYEIISTCYYEGDEVGAYFKQPLGEAYEGIGYSIVNGAEFEECTGDLYKCTVDSNEKFTHFDILLYDNSFSDDGMADKGAYTLMGKTIEKALQYASRDLRLDLDDLEKEYKGLEYDELIRTIPMMTYINDSKAPNGKPKKGLLDKPTYTLNYEINRRVFQETFYIEDLKLYAKENGMTLQEFLDDYTWGDVEYLMQNVPHLEIEIF